MSRGFSLGLLYGSIALVMLTAIGSMILTRNILSANRVEAAAQMSKNGRQSQADAGEAWQQIAAQYFPAGGRQGGVCREGGEQVACR